MLYPVRPSTKSLQQQQLSASATWEFRRKARTEIAQMQNFTSVDKIIDLLEIKDRKLTTIIRMGKYNPHKGPRTLMLNTENGLDINLILKSTSKLRDVLELKIYISPELSIEDAEKEDD